MTTHNLKTWKIYYDAVLEGMKTFEIRNKNRDFQVGDILNLIEVDMEPNKELLPTGRSSKYLVTHILVGGQCGIEEGIVVLAIEPCSK
ncbi:MAG: DUF3850 domain-containing protein [Fischerella sp. CENA71]|nr:DUF3850 domain-containing protein [Fischerella sp. CENA71]